MTSASCSSAAAVACCCSGVRTVLDSARAVKLKLSAASMIAPANARPNDSPNDPAAELTPAASLTRSSTTGDNV